jgi:NADH-quinone oxidoreductase subunit J
MTHLWIFLVLFLMVAASAAVVAFHVRVVYATFALLVTLMGVAGLYLSLGADFVGVVQWAIYVGGILVLLLFGVMFTANITESRFGAVNIQWARGLPLAGLLFVLLTQAIGRVDWGPMPAAPGPEATAAALGRLLLGKYLLPFEVISLVLLMALVGAIAITREREEP